MSKNKVMMMVHIVIALICACVFLLPDFFLTGGYALAVDGVVVARAVCFVFGLYNAGQAVSRWVDENL